jgi:hypothetical protein
VVSAITTLTGSIAKEAMDGKQPRYVHLPNGAEGAFADLEFMTTIRKDALASIDLLSSGVDPMNDLQVRSFALRVARRFGRFPFPDAVVPWLRPLQNTVNEKYRRPNSALGRAFKSVVELRVECSNWQTAPFDLTLHVILQAGTLPELDEDEVAALPRSLANWLNPSSGVRPGAPKIAERIFRTELGAGTVPSPLERHFLWMAFAEALADHCRPKDSDLVDSEVADAVRQIVGFASSDDDFSLAQYRRSEMLDVDHLSPPSPLEEG